MRPCESREQSIFSWQIMFTSKFKNTHPHLEEMPSRFLCDLSGHICGQYCLACGQLSFYCFISASFHRNNDCGLLAGSAHAQTYSYTHKHAYSGHPCIHAYADCMQPCTQHTLIWLGQTISSVPFS